MPEKVAKFLKKLLFFSMYKAASKKYDHLV